MAFPWLAVQLGLMVWDGVSKSKAKKEQAEDNREVANFNADQLDIDSRRIDNQARTQEQDLRVKYAGVRASQRAHLAANGIFVDSGSASEIQATTDYLEDLSAFRIRGAGTQQAQTLTDQAAFNRKSGEAIYSSAKTSAAADLLSSAGQVAGYWYSQTNK